MKFVLLITSVALCFYSCSKTMNGDINGQKYSITSIDSTKNVLIETKNFIGVIFDKEEKSYLAEIFKSFTPIPEQVFKAESIMKKCVEVDKITSDSLEIRPHAIYKLEKYHRQYFGYFNDKGQRIILIKSISGSGRADSRFPKEYIKQEVVLQDGGAGYFYLHTNIDANICFNFYRGS